jgi:hypothetical protein
MHFSPVHNRWALDFVIGGIREKCTVSQIDSKAGAYLLQARVRTPPAHCIPCAGQPLRSAPGSQTALIKGQP